MKTGFDKFDKMDKTDRNAFYRTLVVVASLILIAWGCLVIVKPFIPALLLAIIFTLATWPAYTWLTAKLNDRKTLAAILMTIALSACFIVPLIFLGTSLAENFSRLYTGMIAPLMASPDSPPVWLSDIPVAGPYLQDLWMEYVATSLKESANLKEQVAPKLIAVGAMLGRGMLDVSLGVLIAFFLFRHGNSVARRVNHLITKFVGSRGQHLLLVSKQTLIGVIYGVLGTALAQGALAGIGFYIAGVPGATFLGFVTMIVSFIPMAPPLVWVPAAFWLFTNGDIGAGVFMSVWGLFVISGVDNIIRPYFISLGSSLPLPLIFLGVFGGVIAFGFIGLFIGPTLLTVAYALLIEWSTGDKKVTPANDPVVPKA
jgi:predicted PurR-regulated permease PerM